MTGSLVGGYCGGRFGPRRTILASCVLGAAGWTIIALSSHIEMIVAGRILCGLAASFSTANCSLLVSQYRCIKDRSVLI